VDWFPAEHPAMPPLVADRRSEQKFACAYCHLPDGGGRPETARLAGLPAAYIRSQIGAFQADLHKPALADWRPSRAMGNAVAGLTDEEISSVAEYFSRQKAKSFVRIVESSTVPQHKVGLGIMLPLPGKPVPIGQRIVEMPTDVERFDRRDPHASYVAYVPAGSIERGRRLAASGPHGTPSCMTCHGPDLKGGDRVSGPPLAGQFPTYLFRQLYAFQTGARGGDAAQPMHAVAATLTQADMIALAAYAASRKP
jgi:cytochrome c553